MTTMLYPGEVQYTLRLTPASEAILVDTIKKYIPDFTCVFPDVHFYLNACSLVTPAKRELKTNICFLALHSLPFYPEQAASHNAPDCCLQFILNASQDINEMATWAMLDGATIPNQTLTGMFGAFKAESPWVSYADRLLNEVSQLDLCFELLESIDLVPVVEMSEEYNEEPICTVEWSKRFWVQALLHPKKSLAAFQSIKTACNVQSSAISGYIGVQNVTALDKDASKVQAIFEAKQLAQPVKILVYLTEEDHASLMDYNKQSTLRSDYRENHNLATWSQPLLTAPPPSRALLQGNTPVPARTILQAIKPVSMAVLLDAEGNAIPPVSEQGERIYDPTTIVATLGYIIPMKRCMVKLDIPAVLNQFKLVSPPIHHYFMT